MTATRGGCAESLVLAGLGVAVLGQGAFHLRIQVVVGVLFAAAAAVAVAEPRRRVRVRALLADPVVRHRCVLLAGALALVATWTVLAAGVAGYPAGALRPLALLAGVGVVVAVYATADASDRAGVVPALLGLGGLVALGGIVGVVLRVEPLGHVDGGLWRAAGPLTYANATAALLGVATLAAAGLAVRRGDDRRLGALLTLLLVGLAVTGSRGGLVAVTGGAVLLAGLVGVRRLLTVTLVPGLAALGAAAVLAASAPDGEPARPLLGGAAVALAVGLAAAGAWLGRALRTRAGGWLLGAGLVALVLVAAGLGVLASGSGLSTVLGERFTLASPDRAAETRAALDLVRAAPWTGVGPGNAQLTWVEADGSVRGVDYAHDEYLQQAAEAGIPGLVLLLVLLGVALAPLIRAVRARWRTADDGAVAGVGAAVVAFLLHSAVDFLWHVPALVLVVAGAVALAVAPQPSRLGPTHPLSDPTSLSDRTPISRSSA